jgi:dTDP-4-dehydrorhamnose reductase
MNLLENNHSGIFHITSSDLVSKAEFALMIAEHYGFNRSLFKEISIDSIEGMEKYPRNLDLTNEKYKKLFGEIGTVKEQLEATL